MNLSRLRLVGLAALLAGAIGAVAFTLSFPTVEGLGDKVRLPVFHGALTWVNLAAFGLLGALAIIVAVNEKVGFYRWEEAVRWVSVPLWIIGSVLGLLAALRTWDFTGSKSSPIMVAAGDPRLAAQFWILIAGLALLAGGLLFERRRWLALLDAVFVAFTAVVLGSAILGPGRALHPDSPVMNSDEILIKAIFFGIVISAAVAVTGATLFVRSLRPAGEAPDSTNMEDDGPAGVR